ncbi:hypothetical protein FOA52_013464 [Chlamydomonas sp. UWO 241]|nr:hypothetical protein FOA52_013464 [Chlamydomonas sp. UWO 241]
MLQPAARVSAPELVPAAGESDGRAAAAAKAAAEAPREEAGAAPGPSQTRLAAMEPRLVLQLAGAVARAQRLGLYSAHPTFEAALVRACKAAFYHASSAQLCAFAHDVSGWWECSRSSSSSAAAGGTVPAAPSPVPAPPHHAASSHRSWRALVAASASRMCHRIALGKDTVEPRLVARLAAALLCGGSGGVSTAAAAAPAAAAGSGDAHQGCQQGERALFAGSGSLKQAERSEADALISVALPVLLRCGSRGGGGGGEDAATAAAALAEYVTAGGSRAGARALLSLYTRAQPHCVSLPPHLLARLILSLPAAAASPVWASLSHASAGTKSEAPVSGAGAVVGVSGGSGDGLGASPLAGGAGDGHVEPAQVLSSFGAAARAAAVPRLREFAPGERPAVLHALLAFAESLAGGRQGQGGDGEATGQAHAGEHSQARQASAV